MFELVQSKKPLLRPFSLLSYNFVLQCFEAYKHTLLVDHSSLLNFEITYLPQLTKMHIYEHKTPPTNLVISILVLQYTFVSSNSQNLLTFFCPKKSLCLSNQFIDKSHNSSKFFYKTFVKPCHPIEYLNLLWILWWWHV